MTDPWAPVRDWLTLHAPVSLASLAPPSPGLPAVADRLGFAADAGLTAWWGAHDGATDWTGRILPGYTPYSLHGMESARATWLTVAADVWDESARAAGAEGPAGSPAWAFDERFVPLAYNGSGDDLFVDLRPGPAHGCVSEYSHEQGALSRPAFPGVTALLAALATTLHTGTPLLRRTPSVTDGVLGWDPHR